MTVHKINIWSFDASQCFFYMSCNMCKFRNKCKEKKHKQETCNVAITAEKILQHLLCGHVSGFVADEFFIDKKFNSSESIKKLRKTASFLRTKYIRDTQNVKS